MDKVLIVSDLHGGWGYLNKLINKKQPDIVLQVGDFGWWVHFHRKYGLNKTYKIFDQFGIKNKLNNGKYCRVYWIPGNHENHDDLNCLCPPEEQKLLEIQESVWYCPFGTVLELNGYNILMVGGAESVDKQYRIEGVSWWRDEIITQRDMDCLPDHKQEKIDIVISHTAPRSFIKEVGFGGSQYKGSYYAKYNDPSTFALDIINDIYKPDRWFCGHFHKHVKKKIGFCTFECLDIPEHSGHWWTELK